MAQGWGHAVGTRHRGWRHQGRGMWGNWGHKEELGGTYGDMGEDLRDMEGTKEEHGDTGRTWGHPRTWGQLGT